MQSGKRLCPYYQPITQYTVNSQVKSNDGKWKETSDEFLEVFLVLSDFTFEYLVEDLVMDMQAIKLKSSRELDL